MSNYRNNIGPNDAVLEASGESLQQSQGYNYIHKSNLSEGCDAHLASTHNHQYNFHNYLYNMVSNKGVFRVVVVRPMLFSGYNAKLNALPLMGS